MIDETIILEERFDRLESRFELIERRFAAQEQCLERILALLVRVAERQGVHE